MLSNIILACMRLRKLAQGQSLLFVAPPEVHQNIINTTGTDERRLDGYDVVAWSLEQSCLNIERAQPLRVLQGLSHHQRQTTMSLFSESSKDLDQLGGDMEVSSQLVSAFREKEKQRLTDLYAPEAMKDGANTSIVESYEHDLHPMVKVLLETWKSIDFSVSEGASMHEEHEREVAHEVEQEKQIQRPPRLKACRCTVDKNLRQFVSAASTQVLAKFLPALQIVGGSSAKSALLANKPFSNLWVTKDFAMTVKHAGIGFSDSFLRPVNWILTAKQQSQPNLLLIISQYEANKLWDEIHAASSTVRLLVYEPRVTKSKTSVDCPLADPSSSVNHWQFMDINLRRQLNLFAGQLYFNTYKDYRDFYEDLARWPTDDTEKALSFIKVWTAIRRRGQNFLPTHIGQMVSNRTMKEKAFE